MVYFEHRFEAKIGKVAREVIKKTFRSLEKERDSDKIGYYDLPKNSSKLLKSLEEYNNDNNYLKKDLIRDVVVIGIGGSSLGTKAVFEFLKHNTKTKRKLYFLENVDPIYITETLKKIDKNKALFLVVSKSGTTIETTSIFKYILKKYKFDLNKKSDSQRFVAITDKGSALAEFSNKYSIKQFNIPNNVGGRFSVLSAVGIVPLYLMNIDVKSLLKASEDFVESFFKKEQNSILEKAFFYTKIAKKYPINVLFSYSSSFTYFNQWYVQLWAESLGKNDILGNSVGLTPVHLVGSVDQHSFLQLIIQGPKDKTVTVLKVEDFENKSKIPNIQLDFLDSTNYINGQTFSKLINEECNATFETIVENDIPADLITLDKISASNMGVLISYYELLTSAVGQMLEINTYDQPGVEFGKKKLVKKFKK